MLVEFSAQIAETGDKANKTEDTIRIAFLLTLNGRALRQVHRLLKVLYATKHVYYIHVDEVSIRLRYYTDVTFSIITIEIRIGANSH